jgi:hypothetical protein
MLQYGQHKEGKLAVKGLVPKITVVLQWQQSSCTVTFVSYVYVLKVSCLM